MPRKEKPAFMSTKGGCNRLQAVDCQIQHCIDRPRCWLENACNAEQINTSSACIAPVIFVIWQEQNPGVSTFLYCRGTEKLNHWPSFGHPSPLVYACSQPIVVHASLVWGAIKTQKCYLCLYECMLFASIFHIYNTNLNLKYMHCTNLHLHIYLHVHIVESPYNIRH